MRKPALCLVIIVVLCLAVGAARADTIELADGTVITNCYVRDEGTRFIVWDSLDKVGTPDYRIIPRSQAIDKAGNPTIERPEAWDAHPQLPDLTVTHIEMNPKLAGLHGRVQYEGLTNAPWIGGAPVLDKRIAELEAAGKSKFLNPEYIVQDLKLKYTPGETVTFTAFVMNGGFVPSKPFDYRWLVDDKEVDRGTCKKSLGELEQTTFDYKYAWQDGKHTIGFEIITDQKEIATINNKATDAMWGWGYRFIVDKGRAAAYHRVRSAYGTFSWEDYYHWHITIMNQLFAACVYPSTPEGVIARVRLDKIVYLDDVTQETYDQSVNAPDGMLYLQGCWTWSNSDEENKTGVFADPDRNGRNSTEWSLPHELGHQLGLVDYYAVDYAGDKSQVWPDNGEMICRIENHPFVMMHWHGPFPYSELSAAYFNYTWDKPRGHFGDHYFAIPDENFLRIVDVNGGGVPGAKVEVFQRAAHVDPNAEPRQDHGVTWYPIIQDGNYGGQELSEQPVITGDTDADGVIRLPNRDVLVEVKTLNGFHRKANPFGDINVLGNRGLMLVKVTKDGKPAWFWLEAIDFNIAWIAGHRDTFTVTLKTPYGSPNSPESPVNVAWEYVEKKLADQTETAAPITTPEQAEQLITYVPSANPTNFVRITWQRGPVRDQNYLDRVSAYRVYRRFGPMGLNDRPWWPVATVNRDEREVIVDLNKTMVNDVTYYSDTQRFAVSTLGELSVESELVQATQVKPQ
jgi:hypothetical protein